jgi:CHAT domain-containing protein
MSDSKTKAGILSTEDQTLEKKIEIELSDVQGNLTLATDASPKNMKLIKELESRVFQLNIKKDSLIRTYEKKYPDYYRSRFDRSVVSFDQIETAIGKDEAMLQYSMTPDAIICIAVSKTASQVLSFPVDTLTMARINFIINYMKGDYSSYNSSEMKKYYEASTGLYAILIEPFKSIIQNKDLVIIPDGLLNYISFDALIRPTVGGLKHDFHYYDYLIREHIVSYGFTATLYQYRPEHQKKPSRSILAVAPIYKPSNIQLSDFLKNKSDALPHLAGTLKEAKSAWRSAGGKLLIRNSAREGSFKDLCSNYAILHLAMHTLTDRDKPMNSCLVFTPGADNREDGCLFSHEIYNLSLNSSLVVLSACETGSGELAAGEGIMSLGRAFLYAGCSAMVMTLWTVDDQSSEIIMSDFYNNLMKEQALGAAVRNSKLKYLDESDQLKAHPRFWAGILPVGQNTLLVMPTSKSFNYLWFLLLPVSLLGLYFVQKKRNPRQ